MKKTYFNLFLSGALALGFASGFSSCSDNDNDNDNDKDKTSYSPYITKVLEYAPAPGQFVNKLPEYVDGDTKEAMRQKAQDILVTQDASVITLGGYGGYVVFGFDHTIENKEGLCDFRVKGNATVGNSEPGIIMVAYDANHNGKPDDNEWYEIAGSEYAKTTTIFNYKITYNKPATDDVDIAWTDSEGETGYILKNAYHSQAYYPAWISDSELAFEGTKIANNGVENQGIWSLVSYPWGYADNYPNTDDKSAIDIDWAVDENGEKVNLPGIDFVKVYTGLNQDAGWLGETSTEVAGAEDLHLLGVEIETSSVTE